MPALSHRRGQSRAWESSDDRAGAQGPPRGGGWRGPHTKVQGARQRPHGGGGTFAVGSVGARGGSSELMRLLAMHRSSPSTAPPLASLSCRPSAKSVVESPFAPLPSTLCQGSSSRTNRYRETGFIETSGVPAPRSLWSPIWTDGPSAACSPDTRGCLRLIVAPAMVMVIQWM